MIAAIILAFLAGAALGVVCMLIVKAPVRPPAPPAIPPMPEYPLSHTDPQQAMLRIYGYFGVTDSEKRTLH